jgi:20S proteasome alpha/beta subunit
LANQARVRAQIHKITYDESIDIWELARTVADRMQISTLYAGLRPYGVSFLIGGVDKTGVHLIEADPSGMLYEWFAYAIGRGAALANKILKQKWKADMSEKDALKTAVDILSKTEKEGEVDIAVIRKEDKKFWKLSVDEVKKTAK